VYAGAGDTARVQEKDGNLLVRDPDDESQRAEVGAWYIRIGRRAKDEQLLAKVYVERVCALSIR
jgi:hypothetical protein